MNEFNKAVNIQPKGNAQAFLDRALCFAQTQNWKSATADCAAYQKVSPDEYHGRALHAALMSAQGRRQAARAEFAALVKVSPFSNITEDIDYGPDVPSCADAALGCIAAGNPNLAIAILSAIETQRALDSQEQWALAEADMATGQQKQAVHLYEECLSSDATWLAPRIALIKLYKKQNLDQKARDIEQEAMSLPLSTQEKHALVAALSH
jgi:tetratricopeptide (TPR) repeat protein